MRFATWLASALSAAGQHDDELAVFEFRHNVHLAESFLKGRRAVSTICRAIGLPYLRLTMSKSSIFRYKIDNGTPKRWLSVTRRLSI